MLDACLHADSTNQTKFAEQAHESIGAAQSRIKQSASELATIPGKLAANLNIQWLPAFGRCRAQLLKLLEHYLPVQTFKTPAARVLKISEEEYHLPCTVCGKISVTFRVGIPTFETSKKLVLAGIVAGQGFELQNAKKAFLLLEGNDLKGLHAFIREIGPAEGIDAYCPKCDKTYCWDHYFAMEEYDKGFYDCTYGTCPLGHRRVIDN